MFQEQLLLRVAICACAQKTERHPSVPVRCVHLTTPASPERLSYMNAIRAFVEITEGLRVLKQAAGPRQF